jgi:hypothetical protein
MKKERCVESHRAASADDCCSFSPTTQSFFDCRFDFVDQTTAASAALHDFFRSRPVGVLSNIEQN